MTAIAIPGEVQIAPPAFPRHRKSGWTLTLHYWFASLIWSGVIILCCVGVYALEKYIFGLKGTPYRMIHNPAEFAMRFVGLAHHVIATYFLLRSPRLQQPGGWAWLLGLSGATVLGCVLFHHFGGTDNPIMLIAFYMYFLIHGLRDEAFFYRLRSGPTLPPKEQTDSVLLWLQVLALGAVGALLLPTYLAWVKWSPEALPWPFNSISVTVNEQHQSVIDQIFPNEVGFLLIVLMTGVPWFVLATAAFVVLHRKTPGGFLAVCRAHLPLVKVFGFSMIIVLASIFVGPWTFNLIVLMHFMGWFEFTTVKIRQQPKQVRRAVTWRTPELWMRKSLVGFSVLHGGLAALFLAIIMTNHWALGQAPLTVAGKEVANPLSLLFSSDAFFYWTIAHVTLSFFPRPQMVPKPG